MISRLLYPANQFLATPPTAQCISQFASPSSSLRFARLFSTTIFHFDNFINHYEVLKLPQNCSQAELKKSVFLPFTFIANSFHLPSLPKPPSYTLHD
jgi:hypothetical protein